MAPLKTQHLWLFPCKNTESKPGTIFLRQSPVNHCLLINCNHSPQFPLRVNRGDEIDTTLIIETDKIVFTQKYTSTIALNLLNLLLIITQGQFHHHDLPAGEIVVNGYS